MPRIRNEEDSVIRTEVVAVTMLALLGSVAFVSACTSTEGGSVSVDTNPTCAKGQPDCGASSSGSPAPDGSVSQPANGDASTCTVDCGGGINGKQDGLETDVDCGGPNAPKCAEGKGCKADSDCEIACSYAGKCITTPSCKVHLGGDTCGLGEVDEAGAQHESCCKSLPVSGFTDAAHPGKTVYLDKYEITAGRVRAWIESLAAANGGNPDVKAWIATHRPQIWDDDWNKFLPTGWDGPSITIARRLLGDPRPEDEGWTGPPGPGVILPPPTDQPRNLGLNYQFGSEIYVDLHGNNCGTFDGSYGFPTFFYPANILSRDGQLPRASGIDFAGQTIAPKDLLDVKSMNCITNAMLAAFCAWDGGQLATDEVLDHVTASPKSLGNTSGCGTQIDNHGNLLNNSMEGTVQSGGRCPAVPDINATFDAGDVLPIAGSPLNNHNYHYPDTGAQTHDKSWQVSAPGRASLASGAGAQIDVIRINNGDEPWVDLHGNLNEAALDMSGGTFTGKFALKYRGVGYGSSRSDLNAKPVKGEDVLRIQRPEAKAAYIGGRCMRFK